jgi:arabinose-5-phosphate isomerase
MGTPSEDQEQPAMMLASASESDPSTDDATAIASALRSFAIARTGIDKTVAELKDGDLGRSFAAAVQLIRRSKGRLIVMGIGKSGHIGRKLAATFASTGTPAYFVHPTEASHGDLGMISQDDIVLGLSWSGETSELAPLITYAKRFGVPIIGVTSKADSTLARASEIALVLPRIREACPHGLAPTTSSMLQLAIGDALAIALLEDRGFSPLDFKVFHPGGKLGAQLTFVRDLMHDRLPLLPVGAPMPDAIVEMTSCGFGVVGIVDEAGALVGIITDGDLRRHMTGELLQQPVEEVMSRAPKVVTSDMIASEALEIMESRKISVLFVVEEGRPVGIVHTLDLLRAGVV